MSSSHCVVAELERERELGQKGAPQTLLADQHDNFFHLLSLFLMCEALMMATTTIGRLINDN